MASRLWRAFWRWYESHYLLNVAIAAGLFLLQAVHLVWLLGDVILPRIGAGEIFGASGALMAILVLVDYTEIPALISVSLLSINELRKRFVLREVFYLFALNIQWLHLFWITDEVVIHTFAGHTFFPIWLAWVAILIDYLELPVMVATVKKLIMALRESPREAVVVFLERG